MFYNSHVPCVLSLVFFFFFWYFNIYSISFVYFVKFCIMCRIILNLASFVTSGITLRHQTVNYMFWSIFSLIFFNNYSFIYALSQKLWENEQRNKEFLNSSFLFERGVGVSGTTQAEDKAKSSKIWITCKVTWLYWNW